MIDCCNVDIQYFHKRTNIVLSRKTREKATISIRKISGGFDISIRILDNLMDLFITEKPVVFDRLKSEGKLTIKVPEQLCSISIRDTTEAFINDLMERFSCLKSPVITRKVLSEKMPLGENKENIPLNSPKKTSMLTADSPKAKMNVKVTHSPGKSALPVMTSGFSRLMSPTKRVIAFGTGTPSKIADGRCALSSPHNLRSTSHVTLIYLMLVLSMNCSLHERSFL
jgi:hypothetical protein